MSRWSLVYPDTFGWERDKDEFLEQSGGWCVFYGKTAIANCYFWVLLQALPSSTSLQQVTASHKAAVVADQPTVWLTTRCWHLSSCAAQPPGDDSLISIPLTHPRPLPWALTALPGPFAKGFSLFSCKTVIIFCFFHSPAEPDHPCKAQQPLDMIQQRWDTWAVTPNRAALLYQSQGLRLTPAHFRQLTKAPQLGTGLLEALVQPTVRENVGHGSRLPARAWGTWRGNPSCPWRRWLCCTRADTARSSARDTARQLAFYLEAKLKIMRK